MTLKSTMNIEHYNQHSHNMTRFLRAELGCDEPLCVLAVTAAPGSVILTVVATDRASDSKVHAAANAMATTVDLKALSGRLTIDLSKAPVVQSVRNVQVKHWIVPSPPLQEKENAVSAETDQEDSVGIIAGAAGGGGALLVLALVGAALLKRKKAAALRASTAGPVVATPVAIHVDVMSDVQRGRTKAEADAAAKKKAPATKGPTATGDATTYSVELTKTPMGFGLRLTDDIVTEVKPDSQAARGGRIKVGYRRLALTLTLTLTLTMTLTLTP